MSWHAATPVLAAFCALAAACGGGSNDLPEPGPPVGRATLPDLAPSPPVHLQMLRKETGWHVAFSSILVNVGDGDFLLRAEREGSTWRVAQLIPYSKSGAERVPLDAPLVWGGDGHEHWHVARVATVRLVRLRDGEPATEDAGVDAKVGFCFYDHTHELPRGPENAVFSRETCGDEGDDRIGMGLSRGWNDTYQFVLPGQSINVSGVPDGEYRLWSEADANRWFHEATRRNNVTWVDFELSRRGDGTPFARVIAVGPKPT